MATPTPGRVQPAHRVGEHLDRRRVEPLHVVDRDEERPGLAQPAQEGGGADRHRLGRQRVARPGAQQRDLDRLALRIGQLGQLRLGRAEQIGDRRVAEQALVLGRLGHQHPPPLLDGLLDQRAPQHGLADARLAHERQHAGRSAGPRRAIASIVRRSTSRPATAVPTRKATNAQIPRRFVRGGSGQPRPSRVRFRMSSCSCTWMVWLPVAGLPEPTRDTSR